MTESTSTPGAQAPSTGVRVLLVRLRPSDPAPAEVDHVMTLCAPAGADTSGEEGVGVEEGAVGRSHGVIERIGERLEVLRQGAPGESVARVEMIVPDATGSMGTDRDALAASFAACAAASVVPGVFVRFGDGGAPLPAAEAWAALRVEAEERRSAAGEPSVTAVISAWNKRDDVRANLLGLRAQTRPFDDVVVVDNHSSDGTPGMIRDEFPEVRLVVMPNSDYGACETFNVGFSTALTDMVAILDDDVVLTPWWLTNSLARMAQEPETTAVVSTKVVEPGMPDSYRDSKTVNEERYMSTFRGCASLARKKAIDEAGGYDERLFIYGNERDLTCRLLNLGYRVLQYPGAETFHRTPFGVQMGKRSLYYHARNAFLGMIKYAPLKDLVKMPFLVVTKVLLRGSAKEQAGEVSDAVGTIGIGKAVRQTKGSWWILTKAAASVVYNLPYCLKRRQPVRSPDFDLPLK